MQNCAGARWIFTSLALGILASGAGWAHPAGSGNNTVVRISGGHPALICMAAGQDDIARLKAGDKQLIIVVQNYEPPIANNAGLVAFLVEEKPVVRNEIARFSVHPDMPFPVDKPNFRQRFGFSLMDLSPTIYGERICIEVGFYHTKPAPVGGVALISIEFGDRPHPG